MKKLLTLLFIFGVVVLNAQNMQVSGIQHGTWSGEVHVVEDVFVKSGDTLTVEPGTIIYGENYSGITIYGTFYAEGTENARITFTVADTTGYSNYENEQAGAWRGITLEKSEDVRLSFCDFSYGKAALQIDGGVMKIFYSKNIEISNCTFHHNTTRRKGGALYAEDSQVNIHDCEVYENFGKSEIGEYCWGIGYQFHKCDITMHDMVFHDNFGGQAYGGGMNIDSCNMTLNNAVFYNNFAVDAAGLGIQRSKDYDVKVSNMLAYNNSVVHYGGGLAMAASDPELNNLTIVNNYCGGGGGAGMMMGFNSCPVVNNSIFYGNHAIYEINDNDTLEYYMGSQIWLWGGENYPVFNNGDVQYGFDSIAGHESLEPNNYNNMIEADPMFVDAGKRDYQLLAGSPCINTGTPDTAGLFIPDADLAGGPRIYNERIDMGCYEWNNIGVDEHFAAAKQMNVYPNPLNDNGYCVVKLNQKTDVVLKLISLDGKEIYRENVGVLDAGENHISLDGMMRNVEKTNKTYLLVIDNQFVKIVY